MKFDTSCILKGEGLTLSPLVASDYALLFKAASDPLIWAGHPAKARYTEEVFRPYFNALLAAGGTYVIRQDENDQVIGCSRYYVAEDAPNDIAIGFTFIVRACWGGSVNRRLKSVMMDHAFGRFDHIWLHIAPDNIRSQQAAKNLGAQYNGEVEITLLGATSRNFAYFFERDTWRAGAMTP